LGVIAGMQRGPIARIEKKNSNWWRAPVRDSCSRLPFCRTPKRSLPNCPAGSRIIARFTRTQAWSSDPIGSSSASVL